MAHAVSRLYAGLRVRHCSKAPHRQGSVSEYVVEWEKKPPALEAGGSHHMHHQSFFFFFIIVCCRCRLLQPSFAAVVVWRQYHVVVPRHCRPSSSGLAVDVGGVAPLSSWHGCHWVGTNLKRGVRLLLRCLQRTTKKGAAF